MSDNSKDITNVNWKIFMGLVIIIGISFSYELLRKRPIWSIEDLAMARFANQVIFFIYMILISTIIIIIYLNRINNNLKAINDNLTG